MHIHNKKLTLIRFMQEFKGAYCMALRSGSVDYRTICFKSMSSCCVQEMYDKCVASALLFFISCHHTEQDGNKNTGESGTNAKIPLTISHQRIQYIWYNIYTDNLLLLSCICIIVCLQLYIPKGCAKSRKKDVIARPTSS